ncbi:Os07g0198650 [Oryza sativa Japonica Group]|uniref:Os07g0198650 protein n=1 Tax=Oryza sativa subsp. japonica TaxID=39947 RepID=A0A0P0X3T5_ORYSJ|nr:hypothetical protein EE612_037700 [Oryza sativa]BAT00488.1 Os07g0198650 [Oryza sativa Japonica Group]
MKSIFDDRAERSGGYRLRLGTFDGADTAARTTPPCSRSAAAPCASTLPTPPGCSPCRPWLPSAAPPTSRAAGVVVAVCVSTRHRRPVRHIRSAPLVTRSGLVRRPSPSSP